MSRDETGVRRPSRRRILAALGATAGVGLAGCLGGPAGADGPATGSGDAGTGSPTADEGGPTTTTMDRPTTTERTTIPASKLRPAGEFDCGTLGASMSMRPYDASDRPFAFTFDYPEGWIPEPSDTPTYDATVVHAPYELDSGGFLFDVYVRQYYEPVAEDAWDRVWDDDWEEVGTVTFAGEQRRIVEKPSGDFGRFILSVVVRDTAAATDTYRQVTFDAHTLSFDESCYPGYRELGDAMVGSLRPRA